MSGAPIKADLNEVAKLTRQGKSCSEIADILGVTTRSVNRYRTRLGISKSPPSPLTSGELQRAQEMLTDGCSCNEVARTLGRSRVSIYRHFPGQGWTQKQGAEWGALIRRQTMTHSPGRSINQ